VLTALEAELYTLPFDEPFSDAEFDARLEMASRHGRRRGRLARVDGITVSRGGPCWPGFLLMRDPYLGPYGERTTGRSFVSRAKPAARWSTAPRAGSV
jgi:hypothetical protein